VIAKGELATSLENAATNRDGSAARLNTSNRTRREARVLRNERFLGGLMHDELFMDY
jgi:hypothetical protein